MQDLILRAVTGRGQQIVFVMRIQFLVLDLLLAIEHLPALDAEDLAVRLLLD